MPRDGEPAKKPRRPRWALVGLLVVVLLVAGLWVFAFTRTVSEGYEPHGRPMNFPASKVEKEDQPMFHFDPNQPWHIEFGRGSGWHGLDTLKLTRDGELILFRQHWEHYEDHITSHWETTSARLLAEAAAKVAEAVEANQLLGLEKAYHADVYDGTQWVLRVRQGSSEKAVYFDNHFPEAILRFAERLDEIITNSVGPTLRWREVPYWSSGDHQRGLWESIRR